MRPREGCTDIPARSLEGCTDIPARPREGCTDIPARSVHCQTMSSSSVSKCCAPLIAIVAAQWLSSFNARITAYSAVNLQVQVCAIKREHPVALVNKHGRCTGTLNSDKAWGCCVPSTWAQCIPTGLAQCSDRTVAGMCRRLHEVKNAYVDTTSVRLSVTQCHRLNRSSDFH